MASNGKLSKEKIYTCEYEGCSSSFRRLDRLKCHSRLHSKERPYICSYDDCDKSYIRPSHLKRHEDTHDGKLECTEANCDQIFASKGSLKRHIDIIHHKKKPKTYKCSYCDQEFNKHNWLTKHEYRHTNIKPYQCPKKDCGKRFLFPSKVKRHLKVHNGYSCTKPNCSKIFPKWTLYVKHIKVAHPKIYKCDLCEREFLHRRNWQAHAEVHRLDRTVFLCPTPNCSKFYFSRSGLKTHIKSYHEKRPFKCTADYCHKAFETQKDLNAHLPRHDPNKRFRKRKKKKKRKPNFAAVLSGCVKRKCDEAKIENTPIIETKDQEFPEVYDAKSQDNISKSDETENVYADIQTLLNMITKRSNVNNADSTSIETNCISLKA